ncbi:MAG: family 16 glycoside hydrolase [bacterium]
MVRIFTFFFALTISFSIKAQQTVFSNFDALVWADEFDGKNAEMWRQTTNAEEVFIIQNGEYVLLKKNDVGYGLILPNEKMAFSEHKAVYRLKLDEDNSKKASAGVIIMAQEDGKGAFLVEINGKRQYRISKYNGFAFKPIDSWKKNKVIEGRGEFNTVAIATQDKKYDLYINDEFITSFSEVSYKEGKIGVYIAPKSKANFDFVRVYVTQQEKQKLKQDRKNLQTAEDDPVLTAVITKLREQIVELEIERDSLKEVVRLLKIENNKSKGSWSVQKLRRENRDLKAQIKQLKKENSKLATENANLKDFKETIENGESGDIIITLTKALEEERERVSILAGENEKLQQEIKRLRTQRGN